MKRFSYWAWFSLLLGHTSILQRFAAHTNTLLSQTVIVICAKHAVRSVRYNIMISYRSSNHTPSVGRIFLVCIFSGACWKCVSERTWGYTLELWVSIIELAVYREVNVINHSPNTSLLWTWRAFRAITLNYEQVTMKYNLRSWLCSHLTQQQEGVQRLSHVRYEMQYTTEYTHSVKVNRSIK